MNGCLPNRNMDMTGKLFLRGSTGIMLVVVLVG
jgi:hypothetical protein